MTMNARETRIRWDHLRACISIAAVLAIALGMLLSVPFKAQAAVRGDVDGDGIADAVDVAVLFETVAGTGASRNLSGFDFNADGAVNTMDVVVLFKVIAGEMSWPGDPSVGLTAVDPNKYYGRQLLLTKEKSTMLQAYDHLDKQFKAIKSTITMYQFGLTLPEFERVLRYYYLDHPETFWISMSYEYRYYTENGVQKIYDFTQTYAYSAAQISNYQARLEARAKTLLSGITDAMPKTERERLIHDRLVLAASYDTSKNAANTHNLLGVMLGGTGVCESYSRAFQYLMYRCGIRTVVDVGHVSSGEFHMWNAIELPSGWYMIDVTWDDPVFTPADPDYIGYSYYNITTARLKSSHTSEVSYSHFDKNYRTSYVIPTCTATADNYEVSNAVSISSFDVATMAPVIARSIQKNEVAVFRPTGSYTLEKLEADLKNGTKHWQLINAANTYLSASQQLTDPFYVLNINTTHGLLSIYLRNK